MREREVREEREEREEREREREREREELARSLAGWPRRGAADRGAVKCRANLKLSPRPDVSPGGCRGQMERPSAERSLPETGHARARIAEQGRRAADILISAPSHLEGGGEGVPACACQQNTV